MKCFKATTVDVLDRQLFLFNIPGCDWRHLHYTVCTVQYIPWIRLYCRLYNMSRAFPIFQLWFGQPHYIVLLYPINIKLTFSASIFTTDRFVHMFMISWIQLRTVSKPLNRGAPNGACYYAAIRKCAGT